MSRANTISGTTYGSAELPPRPRRQITSPALQRTPSHFSQRSGPVPVDTRPPPPTYTTQQQYQRQGSHRRTNSARRPSTSSSLSTLAATAPPPAPSPPRLQHQNTSFQTQYMTMLLSLDDVAARHNVLAAASTWALLAGFVVLPGTFAGLSSSSSSSDNIIPDEVVEQVRHIPLLVIASICSGAGALGILYLSFRFRANYVWLAGKLFLPATLNSVAGLLSTLAGVYASHGGKWSVAARVTAIFEGGCLFVCGLLFFVVNNMLLKGVQKQHGIQMKRWQSSESSLGKV
ncbi:hypothetical protein F4780DRAFT_593177 [Xylariomycetidae sp. FL0641]|nr:hypothetical protein F4780DRAFT_593177 [Xylariomycetidae sp. FL0641]